MDDIARSVRYSMMQIARLLGVHVTTVWRWHRRGVRGRKLRATLIGGRRYVGSADLQAFLGADENANKRCDTDTSNGDAGPNQRSRGDGRRQ